MGTNYLRLARQIIKDGKRVELGQRYLDIRRRHHVIRKALRQEMILARLSNPLQGIVTLPLSLAGRSDKTLIVRGEYMAKRRLPVSMGFDSQGRHNGMALDDLMARLHYAHPGQTFTDMQILDLFEQYMAPPSIVLEQEKPRVARLGEWDNRLRLIRKHLEARMDNRRHERRFAAVVSKETVELILKQTPRTMNNLSLVLSFSENVGLLINRQAVETQWGRGCGMAVVARADLAQVVAKSEYAMTIECYDDFWIGWMDSGPSGAPQGFAPVRMQFAYFEAYAT